MCSPCRGHTPSQDGLSRLSLHLWRQFLLKVTVGGAAGRELEWGTVEPRVLSPSVLPGHNPPPRGGAAVRPQAYSYQGWTVVVPIARHRAALWPLVQRTSLPGHGDSGVGEGNRSHLGAAVGRRSYVGPMPTLLPSGRGRQPGSRREGWAATIERITQSRDGVAGGGGG